MAPPKSSRATGDDLKPDSNTVKDKSGTNPTSAKMRRGASQTSASHNKEALQAPTSAPSNTPTIDWSSFEREALHSYRRGHQLNTPEAFVSTFHHTVMSLPGSIGRYSPTMRRKGQARRQCKSELARAVRKHSNALGVQENDVVVELIHKVRSEKQAGLRGLNGQLGVMDDS